ncbi:MAG: RNA polymerase subunit sigma-70, partial [Clostridia bacterium]|nr:RNA polymerase subunit sigma-70 [Clostridia bacterium]
IAVNTCRNILKSREYRLYAKATPLDQLPEPARTDAYPDDTVLQTVLSLPDRYREVVVLHYFQAMPLKDVADALRLPQATVRTRLVRARKLLYPMLKGWYRDE